VNAIGVVFSAEFLRRVRSRPYLFGTIIGAGGVLLFAFVPSLISHAYAGSANRIVLVAPPALAAPIAHLVRHDVDVVETLPRLDQTPTAEFLEAHHHVTAVVEVSRDRSGLRVVAYTGDPSLFPSAVARDIGPLQVALATGTPVTTIAKHLVVPIDVRDVGGRFANAGAADAAKGVALLFVMLLYLSILLNAQGILASVAEEKTSRIAELLVSAIDPAQLLAAKVLAVAATGFIQLGVWIAMGYVAGSTVNSVFTAGDVGASAVAAAPLATSPNEILLFIAFFVVGFAQFGVLYAAAASLISRTEDLGSVTGPLVLPIVGAIFIAELALQFPTNPQIVACSFIPLLAPFVMFTRIAVSSVPAWQLVISLGMNIVVAVIIAMLAGRIYRVGLLLYGRPPSLRQIIATLRA
jgi:ABC-type Na+ efflux pump permease subunit